MSCDAIEIQSASRGSSRVPSMSKIFFLFLLSFGAAQKKKKAGKCLWVCQSVFFVLRAALLMQGKVPVLRQDRRN